MYEEMVVVLILNTEYHVLLVLFRNCFLFCWLCFLLWNNVKFWVSFWRLETNRVAHRQDMTTLLTTTLENISTISGDSSREKSVFSETSAFLEFAEHNKKLEIAEKNMRIV